MNTMISFALVSMLCLVFSPSVPTDEVQPVGTPDAIIINHQNTDITRLSLQDIQHAKRTLHIVYGHTSHGSQLISGMRGLVDYANKGGKGLQLPQDIFAFNAGGENGALDLHDNGMGGNDVGYFPEWVEKTRAYLDDPRNADCNVVMWSWCGQVTDKFTGGRLDSEYLTPMSELEHDYPHVTFVYMTGHVDIHADADNKAANDAIRQFCSENGKVLYDFADIERHNPEGNHYEFCNDNCDYFTAADFTTPMGNWAEQWQDAHIEGVDWYRCGSAHSQPLNANQKAYAAWSLFAEVAKRQSR